MKIKNYIVDNYQLLMSCLEEELCKKGISYVRIDNEIHFQDQIVRFYDIDIDFKILTNWFFTKMINDEKKESPNRGITIEKSREEIILSLDKLHEKLIPPLEHFKPNDFVLADNIMDIKKENSYQLMNKTTRKQESHMVKQKLKRYSR